MKLEIDKVYTFVVGSRDIVGKLVSEDEESIVIGYPMTIMPVGPNSIGPVPIDKIGEIKEVTIHSWAVFGYWPATGKTAEIFDKYSKEMQMAQTGLVYASSLADIGKK